MFKRFFAGFALLGTLVFSGCGDSQTLDKPLSQNYETFQGEFHSLAGVKIAGGATHLFETKDGQILYTYSDRYDLERHLNAPVEAYGMVSTYDNLDKALFEVKRLTEVSDPSASDEAVTEETYSSSEMGVRFPILSSWIETRLSQPQGVSFELPSPVQSLATSTFDSSSTPAASQGVENLNSPSSETASSDATAQGPAQNDVIEVLDLENTLQLAADASSEDRAQEIQDYVSKNDMNLAGQNGEVVSVGIDHVLGVKYRLDSGDVYVFVPRGKALFELSYHFLSQDDATRLENSNRFSKLLNGLRFISAEEAAGSESADTSSVSVTPESTPSSEVPLQTGPVSSSQVSISKYASFTSNAYQFTMNYPAAWYYLGGTTGYVFNDAALDEPTTSGILQLSFNVQSSEGVVRNGDKVSVTRKLDSRSYTLSGPAEYETVMQSMLNSIETTKTE